MPVELLISVASALTLIFNVIGVIAVIIAVFLGLSPYVGSVLGLRPPPTIGEVRSRLGRGLVLSLEIFIAADLLRSVLAPTLLDVAILAVITLVRIALSLSLEYEMQRLPAEEKATQPSDDEPEG